MSATLAYCALRLPGCMPRTTLLVMGQMEDVFRRVGYAVEQWQSVRARARDGNSILMRIPECWLPIFPV